MDSKAVPFGIGAIGLGLTGLAFGDFALQWQPVPPTWPIRPALSYLSALILLAGGAMLLWPRTSRNGALVLAITYGLWVVVLHAPRVIVAPGSVARWLGVAEIGALAAGAIMLLCLGSGSRRAGGARLAARIAFGLSALVFGASHFMYAAFTASMVPSWIPPGGLFWAYATGIAHVAGGVAVLSGIQARLAATCMAAMYGAFALLLHLPRVIAAPGMHAEWVMLFVAVSLAGAAWAIRAGVGNGWSVRHLLPRASG